MVGFCHAGPAELPNSVRVRVQSARFGPRRCGENDEDDSGDVSRGADDSAGTPMLPVPCASQVTRALKLRIYWPVPTFGFVTVAARTPMPGTRSC